MTGFDLVSPTEARMGSSSQGPHPFVSESATTEPSAPHRPATPPPDPASTTLARSTSLPLAPGVCDARLCALAVGIMVLSFADAALTLRLVRTGMVHEWNPFLAALLERDAQLFANVKMGLTGVGVWVLAAIDGSRLRSFLPARPILWGILGVYAVLLLYHLTLFHRTGLLTL